jgi:hypothetical protein
VPSSIDHEQKREPTNQNSFPITKTTTTKITEFQRNDKAKKDIWKMTKGG